jgi:hypothetical protein
MSDGRQVAAVEFDSDTIWVSPSTTGGTTLMILFLQTYNFSAWQLAGNRRF